jgi:hypothetical protein
VSLSLCQNLIIRTGEKEMQLTTLEKAGVLQLLPQMTKIDAMQIMLEFKKAYDIRKDWHYFSNYLDELRTKGILKVVKPGGMTGYALNK